jgi:hypothetical protein
MVNLFLCNFLFVRFHILGSARSSYLAKKRDRFSPEADEISPLIWGAKISQGYSVKNESCIAPPASATSLISKQVWSSAGAGYGFVG